MTRLCRITTLCILVRQAWALSAVSDTTWVRAQVRKLQSDKGLAVSPFVNYSPATSSSQSQLQGYQALQVGAAYSQGVTLFPLSSAVTTPDNCTAIWNRGPRTNSTSLVSVSAFLSAPFCCEGLERQGVVHLVSTESLSLRADRLKPSLPLQHNCDERQASNSPRSQVCMYPHGRLGGRPL